MSSIRLFDVKKQSEVDQYGMLSHDNIISEIMKNLDIYFKADFLANNYSIGYGESIDILALGMESVPLIIINSNAGYGNVIHRGVYCLDWILNHKEAFEKLVENKSGETIKRKINWDTAKLVCIDADFTNYDLYIISQINRSIDLVKYRKYQNECVLLEVISQQRDTSSQITPQKEIYVVEENPLECEKIIKTKPESTVFKIGYCNIDENKHYIVLPNGTKEELEDIPLHIYLGEGQFILVDEYNRLKWAYPYKISEGELFYSVSSFAVVNFKGSDIYIDKGNGVLQKTNVIPSGIQLRDKQIISVDSENNFIRFYKYLWYNADTFMKSVKAKQHKLVFVVRVLSNGMLLRDIETNDEFLYSSSVNEECCKEHQVLCLQGNSIVTSFNSDKFYTLSSFYTRLEYGIVDINDESVFLRKLSGEKVLLNNAPLHLVSGQVVYMDENNNYCGIKEDADEEETDTEKKKISNLIQYKKAGVKTKAIEATKQVLILGNKNYENSYKLGLLKYGFKAEVMDGFESWTKIKMLLKKSDIVVVITSFVSHDTMWKVKKEVAEIPVIYSEHEGINRIAETILIEEQSKEFLQMEF